MTTVTLPLQAAIGVAFLYILVKTTGFLLSTRRPKNFPPGPPTVLGLGNLHQIPPTQLSFLRFAELAKTYKTDMLGLKFGPRNVIVLHDARHVRELWEKRGSQYAGREVPYLSANKVMKPGDIHALFLQPGEFLRRWRTAARTLVSGAGVDASVPILTASSAELNNAILDDPSAFFDHVKQWALRNPLLLVGGIRLENKEPGFGDRFFDAQEQWQYLLMPGNTPPVDVFPILRHVPDFISGVTRRALAIRETIYANYYSLLAAAREQVRDAPTTAEAVAGGKFQSVLAKIIRDQETGKKSKEEHFTESELALLGGSLVEATVDTTKSTMLGFLLAIIVHSHAQREARREIDAVCGGRLPEAKDLPQLPYLKACLLEAFRRYCVVPLGLPRVVTEDDVYMGYHIPAGTTIIANVWAIHMDPVAYPDPERFDPTRYLDHPLGTDPSLPSSFDGRKTTYAFGAGRRTCIGEEFAKTSLMLAMARLLWTFDIEQDPLDKIDTNLETGFRRGLALEPMPFKAVFRVRGEDKAKAVREDFFKSREYLAQALPS